MRMCLMALSLLSMHCYLLITPVAIAKVYIISFSGRWVYDGVLKLSVLVLV